MIKDVSANAAACIGCGACERRCPQVFRIRYKPYSEVASSNFKDHATNILDAYHSCPVQGIEIEGDHPALENVWRPGQLVEKTALTKEVMEVKIRAEGIGEFNPGQYVTVRMVDFLGSFNRAYSVVEVVDDVVTLCVTILENGRAGNFLKSCELPCDLEITAPRGDFKLASTDGPKVFVATGTGLVPLIAMMESCPDAEKTLYFGQRTSPDLFYLDRLGKIPNLEVKTCLDFAEDSWTGYRGRVTDRLSEDGLTPGAEVYACGSDGMMMGVQKVLQEKRHQPDRYYYESFTGMAAQQEQGLNWRQWVRNVHFYSSLVLSGLFLFFGLTGFMASRPEWFMSDTQGQVPPNIQLEKAELGGYLKSLFPAAQEVVKFEKSDGLVEVELQGSAQERYLVEVSEEDRSIEAAVSRPLPSSTGDAKTIAAGIAAGIKGKLDAETVERDGDQIYFSVESVWSSSAVTVDKGKGTYEVREKKNPWVLALSSIHRGKKAGAFQRVLLDLTGLVLVVVTLTGIVFGVQSRNPSTRWTALALVCISFVLAIAMAVNR